jgi:peroxiredoxin
VQLQKNLGQFDRAGIAVFAISYDSVEAQAAFAREYGITFSLLSDANHEAIEATGILNRLAAADESERALAGREQTILKVATRPTVSASIYGIPYPGSYLIGPDGRVIEKLFYRHYRTRPSVATVLRSGFGVDFEARQSDDRSERGGGAHPGHVGRRVDDVYGDVDAVRRDRAR